MRNLDERLEQAELQIKQPDFRENKGLSNEIGYYIFDYPAEAELTIRKRIDAMAARINRSDLGFQVVVYDLYQIMIDTLQAKGYLEKCFAMEKRSGLKRIARAVRNSLRITADAEDNLIVQHIQQNTPPNAVIFLTGVGKCYPLIRSHTVLNNLHQAIDEVPVVMFFPGEYDGQKLLLFSQLKDDNYYRAFKLVD